MMVTSSIPSTIKTVLGDVQVKIIPGLETEKKAHGLWEWNTQTISLDDKLVLNAQRQTLVHELLHTIEDTAGQQLTEKEIDSYAVHIIYLLQHNPTLVSYLLGKDYGRRTKTKKQALQRAKEKQRRSLRNRRRRRMRSLSMR